MLLPKTLSKAIVPCLVAVGLGAGTAHAGVVVQGTGEPAYTNSANNTQWVAWSGSPNYRVEFRHYVNNAEVATEGPYNFPATGSTWVNWSGIAPIPLQEGSQYGICAQGQWYDGSMYFPDGPNSCSDGAMQGKRTFTTIDRTKPTVAVKVAAGVAATKTAALPVHMDFTDNLAGPFPANYVCVQYGDTSGGACNSGQGYVYSLQPSCSQPATGDKTTNAFDCTIDVGPASTNPAPDGQVTVCAISADAAIPDNPSSPDQSAPPERANLSAPSCGSTLLDRTAPKMAITASPATVNVGDVVAFDAVGSDQLSGIKNSYVWTWGDGSKSSGRAVTHAFATAGSRTVTLTVSDNAGTKLVVQKVITVGTGAPQPPAPTAPETNTFAASTPSSVTVPATGTGTINVSMNASSAGRVLITLNRGTTQVAVGGQPIPAGTSKYALTLPANALPGAHTVKVAYTPTGRATITKTLKVTLVNGTTGFAGARAAGSEPTLVGGKPALPDGRYRGPKGRRVYAYDSTAS